MNILKQTKSVKYRIGIYYTKPSFPNNTTFVRFYYAKTSDQEELIRIFWHSFEIANPSFTIKKVEAQKIE